MASAKPWAVGDPCPACSSELKAVPQASDAQRAAAVNRDNPTPLPPTVDSAEPDQVAELGALYRCGCGYQSRVLAAAADADAAPKGKRKASSSTGE